APASSSPAQTEHHGRGGTGETALTGDVADKAKAAAEKAVPGGTVDSATTETDGNGAVYEVHVTKADGSHVTVLEDQNFTVLSIESCDHHGGRRGDQQPQSSPQPST